VIKQDAEPSFKLSLMLSFLIVVIILVVLVLSPFIFELANAETLREIPRSTFIGITISNSCKASFTCPHYDDLLPYDNTNQFYSGYFGNSTDGFFERQPSQFKNHWNFYTVKNMVIIAVDPSAKWINNMEHHITIVPSEFTYFDRGDMKINPEYETVIETREKQICIDRDNPLCWETVEYATQVRLDPVRIERHNQYIHDCSRAVIHESALKDTLNYFLKDCKGEQANEYIEYIAMPYLPFAPQDSAWWHYTQWLIKAQQTCLQKC